MGWSTRRPTSSRPSQKRSSSPDGNPGARPGAHFLPSMPNNSRSNFPLVAGAVRPWHVLFILIVAYVVSDVGAMKFARRFEFADRGNAFFAMNDAINAVLLLAFVFIVPEFRRTLPILFSKPA